MRNKIGIALLVYLFFSGYNFLAIAEEAENMRTWLNLNKGEISDEALSNELNLKYQGGSKTYYDIFMTQKETIELGKKILDPNFPPPTLLDKLRDISYKVTELGGETGSIIAEATGAPFLGPIIGGLFELTNQRSKEFDAISEQNQKTRWSIIKNYIRFREHGLAEEQALNAVYPNEIRKKSILEPKEAEYWYQVYKFAQNEEQVKKGDISALLNVLPLQIQMATTAANSTIPVIQQATQQAIVLSQPIGGLGQIGSELTKKLASENPNFDSSQNSARTPQQKLTPVSTSFTETFNGLFNQSPDYLNSPGGNHSGTLTDGTRVNVSGDSRAGTFTSGSFSGRTIAEPGYTPSTQSNAPFSGTSVGTATARGFQQGTLSGSMTVTIPAGTQTATVSGDITINTDGSLSMPSYSGPVTVNNTGQKVGTMSGKWNQGATH